MNGVSAAVEAHARDTERLADWCEQQRTDSRIVAYLRATAVETGLQATKLRELEGGSVPNDATERRGRSEVAE